MISLPAVLRIRYPTGALLLACLLACGEAGGSTATNVLHLELETQPSATARSGFAFEHAPVLQLRTPSGDMARIPGRVITVRLAEGDGTLGGIRSGRSDSDGRIRFGGLIISGRIGTKVLAFEGSNVSSVRSQPIMLAAGAPATITVIDGDKQEGVAGRALAVAPTVRITDGAGNVVPGAPVRFSLGGIFGAVARPVDTTDTSGLASAGQWVLGLYVGVHSLHVSIDPAFVILTATGTGLTATSLSVGGAHGCALVADGEARCWGENVFGQLGDGTLADRSRPVPTGGGMRFSSIVASQAHTCGLVPSGDVFCWGKGGLLGDGTTANRSVPGRVAIPVRATALASRGSHTCVLTNDGIAWCWGPNRFGEVGDGALLPRAVPVPVSGVQRFTGISAGYNHTCALTATGVAFCWGLNFYGALGDGTNNDQLVPWPVFGGLTFASLGAGAASTCALSVSGDGYCWGLNANGQLGDGTTASRLTPTRIAGGTRFTAISVGLHQVCGLAISGRVLCWGDLTWEPAEIGGTRTWTAMSVGGSSSCGIEGSGQVFCWGSNTAGQIGDGTREHRSSPTPVLP